MSVIRNGCRVLALAGCGLVAACDSGTSEPETGPQDFGEITIQYIQRLPVINLVENAQDPTRDGWPTEGQEVTWRAYLRNWSQNERTVEYMWLLDGGLAGEGQVVLPGSGVGTVDLAWNWTFERHRLEFFVDPDDKLNEDSEENNILEIYTDALSVGFYVEQTLYDFFRDNQFRLGVGSTSWEDWAQRQIARYNQAFEEAVFPGAPDGVLDRFRLDQIHLVRDDGITRSDYPNPLDFSVDFAWGFPAGDLPVYSGVLTVPDPSIEFFLDKPLFQHLLHIRGLFDLSALDVRDSSDPNYGVDLEEEGEPVVGSVFMPVVRWDGENAVVYSPNPGGVMSDEWGDYDLDVFSAMALNKMTGQRTVSNHVSDETLSWFLNDLPQENRILLRDHLLNPLAGATVEVYRTPVSVMISRRHFDAIPDQTLTADEEGRVLVGRNPFGGDVAIDSNRRTNIVAILRVTHEGRVGYRFLDVRNFNVEYWAGHTELGEHELTVTMHDL